jgi:hypothetical protein
MFARAFQLFRVNFTHVNWLAPAVRPVRQDRGSEVTVEPVMRGKRLRGLPRLEPPLSGACAMALRHALILANPHEWMPRPVSFRDGTCNPLQTRE